MTRRSALTILLVMLFTTSIARGAGERGEAWESTSCGSYSFGCRLSQWTAVTVESCDERNCTIRINATAVGGHTLPGTHSILVTYVGEGASLCVVGGRLPGLPCDSICESHRVGWQAGCSGLATVNLSLPSGQRDSLWVDALYTYNLQLGAGTSLSFSFLRLDDGTVEVESY